MRRLLIRGLAATLSTSALLTAGMAVSASASEVHIAPAVSR
jgi:hypothetical protein